MKSKIVFLGEALLANLAVSAEFACVNLGVLIEVLLTFKSLSTEIALVSPDLRVG